MDDRANVRALAVDKLRRAASLPRRGTSISKNTHNQPSVQQREQSLSESTQDQESTQLTHPTHPTHPTQPTQPIQDRPSSPASTTVYEPVEEYHDSDYDSEGNNLLKDTRETGQQVQVRHGNDTVTFSIMENTPRTQLERLSRQERALLTLSQLQHQLLSKHGNSLLNRSNSATARVNAFNKLVGTGQLNNLLNQRPPSRLLRSNTVTGAVGGRGSRDDARQAARANMLKRLGSRRELKNDPPTQIKRRSSLGDISKFDSILNTQPQILDTNLLLVPPTPGRARKSSLESNNSFGTPSSAENGDKFEYERMLNTSTRSIDINSSHSEVESDDDNESIIYEEVIEDNDALSSKEANRRRRQVHFTPSAYIDELRKTLGPDRLAQLLGPQFVDEFGINTNEEENKEEILNTNDLDLVVDNQIDEDIPLTEQIDIRESNYLATSNRKTRESMFKPQPQIHMATYSTENAGSQAQLARSMTTLAKTNNTEQTGKHKKIKSQRSFGSFRLLKNKPSIQSNKEFYDSDPKLSPFPALRFQDNGNQQGVDQEPIKELRKEASPRRSGSKLERKTSKMGQKLKRLFSVRRE
ncbi:hypothetical protein WALSEDRAFT_69584 [Wallemia mellicola CBS 633.66]|uniref:Uncharacterized protein n=1 Tax=Wallemia mellicola (strain ATCC MYA-4683 / CBS 633.66) TaxID=671144 RepID=I4Y9L5_WALMC|nr:hypothetical protein WALSEDRAFT_69584 [Wallemia mellicola CBS 633.66]EIM20657.1 hypothetical protein WALSEDRAFT_69584 [Wallemia mellicola CBS 633.66]|eukprot:XP_006959192.1 hypothetical protein WALSEDRAFT_69584 [Wallemia mellicola CBS 633.66]